MAMASQKRSNTVKVRRHIESGPPTIPAARSGEVVFPDGA